MSNIHESYMISLLTGAQQHCDIFSNHPVKIKIDNSDLKDLTRDRPDSGYSFRSELSYNNTYDAEITSLLENSKMKLFGLSKFHASTLSIDIDIQVYFPGKMISSVLGVLNKINSDSDYCTFYLTEFEEDKELDKEFMICAKNKITVNYSSLSAHFVGSFISATFDDFMLGLEEVVNNGIIVDKGVA